MQLAHTSAYGADQSRTPSTTSATGMLKAKYEDEGYPQLSTLRLHFFRPGELAAFLHESMEESDATE